MIAQRPRILPGLDNAIHDGAILPGIERPPAWMAQGLCAQTDPDAFHPDKGQSTNAAKKICASCPVRAICLEYALEHDEPHGVWGGLSVRERRRINNTRKPAAA